MAWINESETVIHTSISNVGGWYVANACIHNSYDMLNHQVMYGSS